MASFVLRWGPFDHGDEYILPEFGITPVAFYRRVLVLAREMPPAAIGDSDRERVIDLCVDKLAALGGFDRARSPAADHPPAS